jgi:transcriptional regulator GlxA family with amidase domain
MHTVVVLASDGVLPFELSIASKIFGSAEDCDGNALYEVVTCTPDGQPVRTAGDFTLGVVHDRSVVAEADTLVIPASPAHTRITSSDTLPADLAAALHLARPGTRLVSVCLASYVLAAAGLLDGRRATTHWRHTAHFQKAYPEVLVQQDVLYVDASGVLTSAGAAAGVDLCLHLVRQDHGSAVANAVARLCVVPPWREGGQAQFIDRPLPAERGASTSPTRAWAMSQLHRPIAVDELAAHARMSRRTFTRVFRSEVGQSAGEWLTQQRLNLARQLLEETDLSVDHVADQAGFGTAFSLRSHFRSALGTSPSAYRRTFHR